MTGLSCSALGGVVAKGRDGRGAALACLRSAALALTAKHLDGSCLHAVAVSLVLALLGLHRALVEFLVVFTNAARQSIAIGAILIIYEVVGVVGRQPDKDDTRPQL